MIIVDNERQQTITHTQHDQHITSKDLKGIRSFVEPQAVALSLAPQPRLGLQQRQGSRQQQQQEGQRSRGRGTRAVGLARGVDDE